MVFSSSALNITDEDIDAIIQKGERDTAALNNKLKVGVGGVWGRAGGPGGAGGCSPVEHVVEKSGRACAMSCGKSVQRCLGIGSPAH